MYIALKILHVAAVIVFLGNLVTGILWKIHADQTRDPAIIRHTIAGLIRADRWFTVPGVVLILIGGFGAAVVGGLPLLGTPWILWGIILFTVSGIAYIGSGSPTAAKHAKGCPCRSGERQPGQVSRAVAELERLGNDCAPHPGACDDCDDRQAIGGRD